MIALKCKICSTHSSNIENIKNFSHAWAFEGSVNLRVSNAMDHAKGGPHKSAMELYWKNSSISEEEKAEKLRDNQQQSIVLGIASMQVADLQKTKKKFDITYGEIRRNYRFGKEARSRSWHHILQRNASRHLHN